MQTSLQAWTHVKHDLPERQAAVLHALKQLGGKGTMHVVANFLGVQTHVVSGRFSELRKKGFIKAIGLFKPNEDLPARTIWGVIE